LGPQPLASFLGSYRGHPAGAAHRLLVLFNGFRADDDLTPWHALLADVEHDEIRLEHPVLDLAAYREAAGRVTAERYCFLNSFAVVRADGWLEALEHALGAPGVGLVGASGSWGSIRSYNRFMLGLGGRYARVFDDRRETIATLTAVAARHDPSVQDGGHAPLHFARELLERSHGFGPFPAPHIRTSAFMLEGEVLRDLTVPELKHKADALRLESGRNSITAQVERRGLTSAVVGRNGCSYSSPEWPASETFWQADQGNLLIADKQTEDYERGDAAARVALSRYAWGEAAAPGSPAGAPASRQAPETASEQL
jgi:hypothetical protein